MLLAEILRQPNSDLVTWLLVVTLPQIYNGKEQAGQKKKYKRCSWGRKGAPGNGTWEPSPVLQEIKSLKTSLLLTKIKEAVTSRRDPTQLSFQHVKRN